VVKNAIPPRTFRFKNINTTSPRPNPKHPQIFTTTEKPTSKKNKNKFKNLRTYIQKHQHYSRLDQKNTKPKHKQIT
ncbi:hypothetical protein QN399_26695, partial [Pseudomonas sp. 10C3]|uniref:hypothetical protein n=1 Tax=Pseudomonas sp. 10C3 TaxID=3118753 RepID=UPI002E80B829